jgi:ATP-binding cassette, subfamily C, type I secretion system permease/ATPase
MQHNPPRGGGAPSELAKALSRCRGALIGVAAFTAVINVLMLTGPLFMLQVYDRVLPSRSVPTLVGLAILMAVLFTFQGVLDAIRARVLLRIGRSIDAVLSGRVFDIILQLPLKARGGGDGLQPMRDLDQIRSFLGGGGPSAFFDLPWMPLYIFVCFMFHPWIGYAAIAGALIIVTISLSAEFLSRGPSRASARLAGPRNATLEAGRRNAEAVSAMGMSHRLRARWEANNAEYLDTQQRAADRTSGLGAVARTVRLLIQSLVLGLGAYLVIHGEVSAGVIIASSILVSRALAPVEQAVAQWKNFVAARLGWRRLNDMMAGMPDAEMSLELPKPESSLSVEHVTAVPPGSTRAVVHDIAFSLSAGDGLGIIGPSGSGKSSLARLIVGAWRPARGKVRIDGAALDQWSPERLGVHVGYLPQDIELFDGTVTDNIARFEPEPSSREVIKAARAAGVDELVLALPEGYDTKLGEGGSAISAGQRQRIALARALYREPFLVVLDEPNSNLDAPGEEALTNAIRGVRDRGGIVVVIAHRPSAIAAVDLVLLMADGAQKTFGPKDEVLRTAIRPVATTPQRATS